MSGLPTPDEALDNLAGIQRARELYGDPPAPDFAAAILRYLDAQGLDATFIPTLSDEGDHVWALEIRTGRGAVAYRPGERQTWREYLGSRPDGLELLPPDLPRV